MNQKNIEQLAARLESLGCGPSIRARLAAYICFAPVQFEIRHCIPLADGQCDFFIHCIKGDQGLYDAVYYTAVLKRKSAAPAGMEELDLLMGTIDWVRLYSAREAGDKSVEADAAKAGDLMRQLFDLDTTGVLRFRYWAGTALEIMVPNLALLKSQNEIAQRFYLLPDQPPIRFDEACRFLGSRWMEKKINADRKLLVKNDRTEPASNTGAKGGKLLTKRTKANRKPGLFNR